MKSWLSELEELERKATPGPWIWVDKKEDPKDLPSIFPNVCDFGNVEQYYPSAGNEFSEADAALVISLRNAAPKLFSLVRTLEHRCLGRKRALVLAHHWMTENGYRCDPKTCGICEALFGDALKNSECNGVEKP